ncbi:HIT-like domain, partial [Trinorchestia longiramus]
VLQWIYNILDGVSEVDRVILRDADPETGFVLLPDLKWTGEQLSDLYCQAIVNRRDLASIRDLTGDCLPLLRNIRDK